MLPIFLFETLSWTLQKKKSTYNLMCSPDTHFPVNWLFKQKSFNNNENKVLHSFLKSSSIPYCVVRFWVWGKNLQLWTWHNFCCRHYTVKLFTCTCDCGLWSIPYGAYSLQFSFIEQALTSVSAVFWFLLSKIQCRLDF